MIGLNSAQLYTTVGHLEPIRVSVASGGNVRRRKQVGIGQCWALTGSSF